jgi:hypothetical protein
MKPITTLEELFERKREEFSFDPMSISLEEVIAYGKESKDLYPHNTGPTRYYDAAVVQGSFIQAVFTDFHKQICPVENICEPIKMGTTQHILPRAVYVGRAFIPWIRIDSVKKRTDHFEAIWDYKLLSTEAHQKPLTHYSFVWWYMFFK